jgi:hypothetical protein
LTAILTQRVIQLANPSKSALLRLNNAEQVAAFLIIYSTVEEYTNPSGEFFGAFDPNGISGGFVVSCRTALSTTGSTHTYWIPAGEVYKALRPHLVEAGLGIAFRRPDYLPGYIIDASPISSTYSASITSGRFDLVRPSDLTVGGDAVIFDADKGHFNNIKWLESVKNARTIGYLNVPNTVNVVGSAFNPGFPNANMRTKLGLLGHSYEDSLPPDETEGTTQEIEDALIAQMREKLAEEYGYAIITDAEVSQTAPYRYLRDYELGDYVGVYSVRYGFQKMQVTEFVRSWDEGVETSVPTLVQVHS